MTMEALAVTALLILFVGIFAAAIIHSHRQTAARVAAIEARGWRHVAMSRGFRVEGGDPIPWTLSVSRPEKGKATTRWEAPAAPSDGVVLVGPKVPAALASLDLGGTLAQLALRALFGDDARHLADAGPVEVGSEAFRARFSVLATSPAHADALIDADVERALLDGPEGAAVLRWQDRLQLRVPHGAYAYDEVVAVVDTGEAIARRCGFG